MTRSRRDFMAGSAAGGFGLLAFTVGGYKQLLSPAQAREINVPFRTLTRVEVNSIEVLGETLLPGSPVAGLAHYLDQQLSGPAADCMLMIKYLGVSGPLTDFYRGGLQAAASAAHGQYRKSLAELAPDQRVALVAQMSAGKLDNWRGPPAGLFYFVLRSDAVDVTYGTPSGFEALGVPYMAHIAPPSRWGE
jgi:hypothetical protein